MHKSSPRENTLPESFLTWEKWQLVNSNLSSLTVSLGDMKGEGAKKNFKCHSTGTQAH